MTRNIVFTALMMLTYFSCESVCLKQVKDFDQFKKESDFEYIKFNNVINEYIDTNKLIVYIDLEGCHYVNQKIYDSSLESTIYNYLAVNRKDSHYEVVVFADPQILTERFQVLSDTHLDIRSAYFKLWKEISYENFQKEDLRELSYADQSILWANLPAKNKIRFDYLSEDQAEAVQDSILLKLPPINPFMADNKRGLKGLN